MPSATKNATAVDAGSIREDMWNFGDEVGLDEFLSNIPDGDGVSALGGVEKGHKTSGGGKAKKKKKPNSYLSSCQCHSTSNLWR